MEIQSDTYTTYTQEVTSKVKTSATNEEFKVDNKISEYKYTKDELQYIRNSSKIFKAMGGASIELGEEIAKNTINARNNPDFEHKELARGLFPKLSDEFTNSLLATSEKLSQTDFQMLVIMISEKNQPTLDDRRYYSHSGEFGTSSYKIVPKNDPKYPINEYGKENFESNETILSMLNSMLEALIESQKKFGGDISFAKNAYEILIDNFNKEITKLEDEKNAILENITKNNKPNPLVIKDNKSLEE